MKEFKIGEIVGVQGTIEEIIQSKNGVGYVIRFIDNINGIVTMPAYRVQSVDAKGDFI